MSDKTTAAIAAEQQTEIHEAPADVLPAVTLDELEQVDLGTVEQGELTSRNYEDKDGNHRKATEITVSSVHFCDSKKDGAGAGHQDTGGDFADYPDSSGDFTEVDDNGDLPF